MPEIPPDAQNKHHSRRELLLGAAAGLLVRAEGSRRLPDVDLRKLASDPLRPQYHFLPAANWMNDPNGPIYFNGAYHMFYQHNPNGAYWGDMHWGHAISHDMLHWRHLPIALAPSPGGPDKDGVFTGSTVIDNGTPTVMYTGVNPEVQMIATSNESVIRWTKFAGNPVISGPPAGLTVKGFRDPTVWKEKNWWYAAIGSGFAGIGGAALLYRSSDLRIWEYMHVLSTGKMQQDDNLPGVVKSDDMWECPDFFSLGSKHVLMVSTAARSPYFIGDFVDHQFLPKTAGYTDFGWGYAAKTMPDARGRRICWSWIRERRTKEACIEAGWAGVLSLPHLLSLQPDGPLSISAAPETRALRGARRAMADVQVKSSETTFTSDVSGDCIEILAEFEPGEQQHFGLNVRCSSDGSQKTRIGYNRSKTQLYCDTRRSSTCTDCQPGVLQGGLPLAAGEPLTLNVFIDASVIEIFANGRACLTDRIYPAGSDAVGIGFFSEGGTTRLKSIEVWDMQPISSDRMTST